MHPQKKAVMLRLPRQYEEECELEMLMAGDSKRTAVRALVNKAASHWGSQIQTSESFSFILWGRLWTREAEFNFDL